MFEISDKRNIDKNEMYLDILEYTKMLMKDETDYIANLANISALLNQMLSDINWVGFCIARHDQLVLGPFQGKVACIRIDKGKGVCGTAFASGTTQLVDNVHAFAGHIACDSDTKSEIVVPIIYNTNVVAVLDIDSPILSRFDETDKSMLENLCNLISKSCNWSNI